MKILIVLCAVLACANAGLVDCSVPPEQRNGLSKLLCSVKDAAVQAGKELLNQAEQLAVQGATELGGKLVSGLQNVANAALGDTSTGKRELNLQDVVKMAKLVEGNRNLVSQVGGLINNVTHVTLDKVEQLLNEYITNPSDTLLAKISAFLGAHRQLQGQLSQWIDKHVNEAAVNTLMNMVSPATSKRDLGLLNQVLQQGQQLVEAFHPLTDTLNGLVGGLRTELQGVLKDLVPANPDQVKGAVTDLVHTLEAKANPVVNGILKNLEGLLN